MSTTAGESRYMQLRQLGDNAPFARRNHRLGVTAGTFAQLGQGFIQPELILVPLIYSITGSALAAGAIPTINKIGIFAPQLLVSSWLEHLPRRRPAFIILTVARSLAHVGLVASMWLLAHQSNAWTLGLFFGVYLLLNLTSGSGHIIFTDMVGRLIPPFRVGSFIGMRNLMGGWTSAIVALLVIQPVLSRFEPPLNYVALAAIGTTLAIIDMSIWCQVFEKPSYAAADRISMRDAFTRGFVWLKEDSDYRHFLGIRLAFRLCYLGIAFFMVLGMERLGGADAAEAAGPAGTPVTLGGVALLGGVLIGSRKVSEILGAGVWGTVSDRCGSRLTIAAGGLLLAGAPLAALAAPLLPEAFAWPLPGSEQPLNLPLVLYILALAMYGFGIKAVIIGGQRFLITSAPPENRPSYVGFVNTLTSPLTLLPLLAGLAVEVVGMDLIFAVAAAGGFWITFSGLKMSAEQRTA